MDRASLSRRLRDALAHVQDIYYLESHPLATLLGGDGRTLSGTALRKLLLDAIDGLKPRGTSPSPRAEWRRYQHLVLRYVDGLSMEQVERKLEVSPRQASRDHQQALDLLASHFLLHLSHAHVSLAEQKREKSVDPQGAVIAADAVSDAPTGDLAGALLGATKTLRRLRRDQPVIFDLDLPDTISTVAIDPVSLRQALLHLLTYVSEQGVPGTVRISGADQPVGVTVQIRWAPASLVADRSNDSVEVMSNRARPIDHAAPWNLFEMGRHLLEASGGTVQVNGDSEAPIGLSLVLPPSRQCSVLVIDDNPDVVELFRRFLRGEPYRLVQATSGTSALRLVPTLRPDVIVLDVVMPSQDGWDILGQLRSTPGLEDTPVIICSVLAERALAKAFGAADFLEKPVTPLALRSILESWSPLSRPSRARS